MFRPPPFVFDAETRWVLLSGLGPGLAAVDRPLEPQTVVSTANRLALAWRIGGRYPAAALSKAAGSCAAQALVAAHAYVRHREQGLVRLIAELASLAADADIPVLFLKFAALHLRGVVPAGTRRAGDLDVLVPRGRLEELARRLRERGFRTLGTTPADHHHLPTHVDREGRVLDLHRRVPCVHPAGPASVATFEALHERGALEPVSALPGDCSVPSRELIAAHLFAHTFVQHGLKSAAWGTRQLLADLIDLGPDPGLAAQVRPWLAGAMADEDIAAAWSLAHRLSIGDATLFDPAASDQADAALLRHTVAAALCPEYLSLVRLTPRRVPWNHGAVAAARAIREALFPSEKQLVRIYGRPPTWARRVRRTLAHPVRLAVRAYRYRVAVGGPSPGGS